MPLPTQYVNSLSREFGASAGTRTRVQALATPGDNHYTTLAVATNPQSGGINDCRHNWMLIGIRIGLPFHRMIG